MKAVAYVCSFCRGAFASQGLSCGQCGLDNTLQRMSGIKLVPERTGAPVRSSLGMFEDLSLEDEDSVDCDEPQTLAEVSSEDFVRFSSGIWSLDKVLDGGFAYGATVIVGGDKGVGKTTLTTRALMDHACLYPDSIAFLASGEEPVERFNYRLKRLGYKKKFHEEAKKRIHWSRETDVTVVLEQARKIGSRFLVFDSLRKFTHPDVATKSFLTHGPAVIDEITSYAQEENVFCLIISRLTKAGKLAGAEDVAYDVDAVLRLVRVLQGRTKTTFVKLVADKNRLGREEFEGYFRKADVGLLCVKKSTVDATKSRRPKKISGSNKNLK